MNELFMYIVKKIFLIKITLQVTINRKFGLEDVIYIHNRILFSHKKEWSIAIVSNMSEPREY